MLQLCDGTTTYQANDWTGILSLVEGDGDFDFSRLNPDEVRWMFGIGRWWEKDRPGIRRLEQQVRDGAVDYFTYTNPRKLAKTVSFALPQVVARAPPQSRGAVASGICFVPTNGHETLLEMALEEHGRFGEGMRRLPPEVATPENVRTFYAKLRLMLYRKMRWKLEHYHGEAKFYVLRGWLGSYLVSSRGNAHLDRRIMLGLNVWTDSECEKPLKEEPTHDLPKVGERLLLLCGLYPELARNPVLLLPSLREAESWGECVDKYNRVASSFLIATPELLKFIDYGRSKLA